MSDDEDSEDEDPWIGVTQEKSEWTWARIRDSTKTLFEYSWPAGEPLIQPAAPVQAVQKVELE